MKKLLVFILLFNFSANAGWVDEDKNIPLLGCASMTGITFLNSKDVPLTDNLSNLAIWCAVGYVGGMILNNYTEKKVGERYQEKIRKISEANEDFLMESAKSNEAGNPIVGPKWKKRRTQSQWIGNVYRGECVEYVPDIPGERFMLGD